jgi:Flp pilus assembly protein TadG
MSLLSQVSAKKRLRSFFSDVAGVAAVEFACLAPLLMLMTFGTFEVSRALLVNKRFQRATAMVGDLVSREKQIGDSPTDASDTLSGMLVSAEHVMQPYSSAPLQMAISQLRASSTDATKTTIEWAWSYHNMPIGVCGQPKSLTNQNIVTKGNAVIVVEAKYSYKPLLTKIIPGLIGDMTWTDTMMFSPRYGSVFYGQDKLNTLCPPGTG